LNKKVIIIGSGIAGIASAIRLTAKGYIVSVYEANSYAGGKLSEVRLNNYRFDAGPSLFTMPQFVDELFILLGEVPSQKFEYLKLNNGCNYFYPDGTAFEASSDIDKLSATLNHKLNENEATIANFFKKSALLYKITAPVFLENSLHKLSTYFCKNGIYGIANLWRLNLLSNMNSMNSKTFKNSKTVQFFNRFATYNGSNPYLAPATLNIIPHLEFGFGSFFPKKGMIDITNSLVSLAERHGVEFHYNQSVSEIIVEKNSVKGIKINSEIVNADIVICNMDVFPTYKKLLTHFKMPRKVKNVESSSSALIFYWGIKKIFPSLDLHNILFSENYETEFDSIFKYNTISSDPTVYINISNKYKLDDAPIGCENWFVMINVPSNTGQDWDSLIHTAREAIIAKISKILNCELSELIECEQILDPRTIEQKTSSYRGALYGSSSNKMMAAFFRHSNFSSSIKNLYFCGGSVHPGGGIPLCLLSAKITSDMIK